MLVLTRILGVFVLPAIVALYGVSIVLAQKVALPTFNGYYPFWGGPAVLIGLAVIAVGAYLHFLAMEHFELPQTLISEPSWIMWIAFAFVVTAVLWITVPLT